MEWREGIHEMEHPFTLRYPSTHSRVYRSVGRSVLSPHTDT